MNHILINNNSFHHKLSFFFLVLVLFIQPVYKYLEYVQNFPRLNVSILIALVFILFFLSGLPHIHEIKFKDKFSGFWLLLFVTSIQIISFPWAREYGMEKLDTYLKVISKTIFSYWTFWFVGFYIFDILRNKQFVKILFVLWTISTTMVIVNALSNEGLFSILLGDKMIYLMLADTYAILSILFFTQIKGKLRALFMILSCIALFALLSRTSFYLFIFIGVMDLFYTNRRYLIIGLLVATCLLVSNFDIIENNRMFRIILTGKDASKSQRVELLEKGINEIKNSWLLGNFMGEIESNRGHPGKYIHNYLSFWRQFGIIPFIIFVALTIKMYCGVFILWINTRIRDSELTFIFYFTTFVLLEIIIARSYQHPYIWLSLSSIPLYLTKIKKTVF